MMEKIIIPYNEAGKRSFEVFYRVAEKLYKAAQAAVDEWMAQNFPEAEIIRECYSDGRHQRLVRTADSVEWMISYDYRTKEVSMYECT